LQQAWVHHVPHQGLRFAASLGANEHVHGAAIAGAPEGHVSLAVREAVVALVDDYTCQRLPLDFAIALLQMQ
jgi:hypothetical protein